MSYSRIYSERMNGERRAELATRLNTLLRLIDRAEQGEQFAVLWLRDRGANAHEQAAQLFAELAATDGGKS